MDKENKSNDGLIDAQKSANQENMTEAQRRQHYRELRKAWEENNSPAKKAEEAETRKIRFMSDKRIKDIISFVATGEMEDDSIGKDEETELSDVLDNVLDNFSEDEQNFIFQTLLEETTDEIRNYVTAFLKAKMEDDGDIPYDTARYLAMECESKAAAMYFGRLAWDPDEDPMLVLYLVKTGVWEDEVEVDDALCEFLKGCPNPDEMDWLEYEFSEELISLPYEFAVAYYHNADFEEALYSLINGEDGVDIIEDQDEIAGSGSHFLINILDGIKEDHPQDFEETIKHIISQKEDYEKICEICAEEQASSMALRIYAIGELDDKGLLKKIITNAQQVEAETINPIYGQLSPEGRKILSSTLKDIDKLTPTDRLWWDVKAQKDRGMAVKEAQSSFRDSNRKDSERVNAGLWLVNNGHITATDDLRWIFEHIGDESLDTQKKYVEQHLVNDDASIGIFIDRAWRKGDVALAIKWMKQQTEDDNYLQRLVSKGDYETIKKTLIGNQLLLEDRKWLCGQLVPAMNKINDLPSKLSFASILLKYLRVNDEKVVRFLADKLEDSDEKAKMLEQYASKNKHAQYYLANHYRENGDLKAALPWLKKAADNGMSDGMDNLNTVQQFGDYISAAKQCGNSVADWVKGRLAVVYNKLPDGDDKLQIARKYRSWLSVDAKDQMGKLVELGDADATFDLYKQNHSIKMLRKAASLGNAEAQYQLGLHLLKLHDATPMWKKAVKAVKGTKTNKQKAKEWFAKAAKQGHRGAIKMLK